MPEPLNDKDQEKGDEVLRRLLKTPPDHKTGKGDKKDKAGVEHAKPNRNRP